MVILAIVTTAVMLALGGLHLYWGYGGCWPGKSRRELVDIVVGEGDEFPSLAACWVVTLLLVGASVLPLLAIGWIRSPIPDSIVNWALILASVVLGLRGLSGYLPMFEKRWTSVFVKHNKRLYCPLCFGLAICYGLLAWLSIALDDAVR